MVHGRRDDMGDRNVTTIMEVDTDNRKVFDAPVSIRNINPPVGYTSW
jgi:hypothetical protein